MKDAVYSLLELEETIENFVRNRNIPPTELSRVSANKTRRVCRNVLVIFNISNLSVRNMCILMSRECLNILILYGRCTGLFAPPV
jgi:hypothetical protein